MVTDNPLDPLQADPEAPGARNDRGRHYQRFWDGQLDSLARYLEDEREHQPTRTDEEKYR